MRVGLSSFLRPLKREFFAELRENRIDALEISEGNYDAFDFSGTARLAAENGVELWSFHLPFWHYNEFDPSRRESELRRRAVDTDTKLIRRAAEIGIQRFVVHASGEPIADAEREDRKKYARESLSLLADAAAPYGARICVETLPRTCLGHSSEEMLWLLAEDGRLRICLDNNHITTEAPDALIRALGERIETLHISDFDFVDERHWLPGEGDVDWQTVLAALRDIGYEGVFLYEVGFKTPKTLLRPRDLTAADFRRNADELFTGKVPTVIAAGREALR